MLVFAIRRLGASAIILVAATFFVFVIVDRSGDPLAELLLQSPPPEPHVLEAAREGLYLDRSAPERYWLWLTGWGDTNGDIGLLQGKWGPSVAGTPIGPELADRLFITVRLVAAAIVLSFTAAIVTGVISAVKQYSKIDHVLTFIAFIGLAMPIFWIAGVLQDLGVRANEGVGSQVINTFGESSPGVGQMGFFERAGDVGGHLILPTLALAFNGYAAISRYQRASMLEVLNSDYVRLARAKGVPNRVVMRRHALRTALIPVVTLGTLAVAGFLGGAVVTEVVFRWRGLGTFLVQSINERDVYAVMAVVLLTGFILIAFNLLADLLYGVLDPRIRL